MVHSWLWNIYMSWSFTTCISIVFTWTVFTYQAIIQNVLSKNEVPGDSHSCPSSKKVLKQLKSGLFWLANCDSFVCNNGCNSGF